MCETGIARSVFKEDNMNDYQGRLLHDAHYEDLLKEARGGLLLKAARASGEPRRSPNRMLAVKLITAVAAALLAWLTIGADFEPKTMEPSAVGSPYAISQSLADTP
jgi:hypothetical protein